jgi:hypothetical protein
MLEMLRLEVRPILIPDIKVSVNGLHWKKSA